MRNAKVLITTAQDIAEACKAPVHKVCRDRKNGLFDFGNLESVAVYIGMMKAKKELTEMR